MVRYLLAVVIVAIVGLFCTYPTSTITNTIYSNGTYPIDSITVTIDPTGYDSSLISFYAISNTDVNGSFLQKKIIKEITKFNLYSKVVHFNNIGYDTSYIRIFSMVYKNEQSIGKGCIYYPSNDTIWVLNANF